eukprot:gene8547-33978_t
MFDRVPWVVNLAAAMHGPLLSGRKVDGSRVMVDAEDALKNKYVALFFGRHDEFTTDIVVKLKGIYRKVNAAEENMEVVFVSNDTDRAKFEDSLSNLPWLAIPFEDGRREEIRKLLKVVQVPKIVMVDPEGHVLNRQVVKSVILDTEGKLFPWAKKANPSCLAFIRQA